MLLVTGPHSWWQGAKTLLKKFSMGLIAEAINIDFGSSGYGTSENGHLRLVRWGKPDAGFQRKVNRVGESCQAGGTTKAPILVVGPINLL